MGLEVAMFQWTMELTVNLLNLREEKSNLPEGHGGYASDYDSNQSKNDLTSLEHLESFEVEISFRSSTAISVTQLAAHVAKESYT